MRGTGEAAIEAILAGARERGCGPFTDLFDFCRRVDKRVVNRRCIEALVRAGAFDGVNANRASLLASVGRAIEAAEQAERAAVADEPVRRGRRGRRRRGWCWSRRSPGTCAQRLTEEKAALGYCLSGHLFSVYERELKRISRARRWRRSPRPRRARLDRGVVVSAARVQMTRRGRMMVVMLDDGSAQLEISVFNELFEKHRDKLKEDRLLVVQGKVQRDDFINGLRVTADDLLDLAALRARFAARACASR